MDGTRHPFTRCNHWMPATAWIGLDLRLVFFVSLFLLVLFLLANLGYCITRFLVGLRTIKGWDHGKRGNLLGAAIEQCWGDMASEMERSVCRNPMESWRAGLIRICVVYTHVAVCSFRGSLVWDGAGVRRNIRLSVHGVRYFVQCCLLSPRGAVVDTSMDADPDLTPLCMLQCAAADVMILCCRMAHVRLKGGDGGERRLEQTRTVEGSVVFRLVLSRVSGRRRSADGQAEGVGRGGLALSVGVVQCCAVDSSHPPSLYRCWGSLFV